jgi:hypothetical protein
MVNQSPIEHTLSEALCHLAVQYDAISMIEFNLGCKQKCASGMAGAVFRALVFFEIHRVLWFLRQLVDC